MSSLVLEYYIPINSIILKNRNNKIHPAVRIYKNVIKPVLDECNIRISGYNLNKNHGKPFFFIIFYNKADAVLFKINFEEPQNWIKK